MQVLIRKTNRQADRQTDRGVRVREMKNREVEQGVRVESDGEAVHERKAGTTRVRG